MIALEAFEKTAQEPKVMFEMADDRLDSRSAAKAFSHDRALGSGLSVGRSSRHQDLRAVNEFSAPVTPVLDCASGSRVGNGLGLVKDFRQGV
ncbi:MAG: hypothetical protein WCD63_02870, partial [Terrimicrobiaceae bacterium]